MGLRTPRGSRQHVGGLVRIKKLVVRATLARRMRSDDQENDEESEE